MTELFLGVRVLHIMFGAMWLGAAVFVSLLLVPAMRDAGPDAGKVMLGLGKRRIDLFIGSISGLTVLTGLWLYWRYTDGFNPAFIRSAGAHIFATGGALGVLAAVLAGSVVVKNMKRAIALLKEIEKTDAAARPALMARIAQHRQKAGTGGRIVMVLLLITITLMALGHYV
jgi:uncharacterized membrane protein